MANEFIEIISEQTKKQINDIMPLVKELADQITKINTFKPANTPSGADKNVQAMNDAYKEQGETIKKVNEQRTKAAALTTQQKVDNAIILKQEKQQATLTSAYADAYAKLNAQRTIAKTKLQDLIASETASNKEIKQAQKEFDVLNKKVAAADKAVGRFSDANRKINGLASSVGNLMTAFGVGTGIYLAIDIAKNIYETTKALQSLDLALKMVSGSEQEFASNRAFITATAEKWGVEIKTLTEQYTYFYTAAKGLMSTAEIKTTFEGIAKAGAVMGLSLEKQSAAFYAFEQMMSKGIVTSEELKKQLGNSMPGAIRAAAMAYMDLHPQIKSIQEAEKMLLKEMKNGAIDSATYVPLIVKNLEKLYGIEMVDKVETLQASQNRLKNSWTDLVKAMNDSETSGVASFFKVVMVAASNTLELFNNIISSWDGIQKRAENKGTALGESSFTRQLTEDYKPLTTKEKNNIDKRIKEIDAEILKATTSNQKQAELRGEKEGLLGKVFSSDKQKVLRNIREGNKTILDEYQKEYIELDKKTKELAKNLTGSDYDYFVSRGVDPKRKAELKGLVQEYKTIYYKANALLNSDGKVTKKDGVDGTGSTDKSKRERKAIDFTEAVSGIELMKAENERELALLKERMDNEEMSFDERLKLRTEFSLKSLEIIDDELEKEKAIINQKGVKDIEEVNRAFRNGDIKSKEEAEKQKAAIINRVNNEIATSDIKFSEKWQGLMDSDADYYKNIQRQKRDIADETASILLSIEKDKFDRIVKNEELGINYSLKARQKAFDASLALSRKELDIEHIKALARANPDEYDKITASYEKANIALNNLVSPTKEAGEATRKLIESLSDGALDKALDNIGLKSAKNFLDFKIVTDETGTHLQSTFEKMMEDAKATESQLDDLAIAFNAIGNVALDAMSIVDQVAQQRHQNALSRLEKEKETSLKFAGDSVAAKSKIEADYDKRKQALEKKEFKRQQKMALANIAINTAMGVMSVMSTGGGTRYADFGMSAGILTAIVVGLGAVQAGMVLAQKPPEYWKGTDNAEAGLAWTQERGAEIVTDKHGHIKDFGSNQGAKLTMMSSGDKVITANETKKIMFDSQLNNLLSDNGIKEAKIEIINQGLTIDQMDSVLSKHFSNITTQHVSFDNNGVRQWSERNGNITTRNESRGSGKGFSV